MTVAKIKNELNKTKWNISEKQFASINGGIREIVMGSTKNVGEFSLTRFYSNRYVAGFLNISRYILFQFSR